MPKFRPRLAYVLRPALQLGRPASWVVGLAVALGSSAVVLPAAAPPVAGVRLASAPTGAASSATPSKATPSRSVVVGKATLNWHLQAKLPQQTTEQVVASFRAATAAHLLGTTLPPRPATELLTLAGGVKGLRLPSEFIHAMFVGPIDGGSAPYCSDSTVVSDASVVRNANREDQ